MIEKFWGSERLLNVSESTAASTLQRLVDLGLHPSTIPDQLGGSFTYERDFKEWLATRLVQEQVQGEHNTKMSPMMLPTPVRNRTVIVDHDSYASSSTATATATVPQLDSDMSSTMVGMMGKDRSSAGSTNDTKGGNSKLKSVGVADTFPPVKETRKRNCEYSRRHYYKKKNQVENLQAECEALKAEHQQLQDTQNYLINLLHQAQTVLAQYHHGGIPNDTTLNNTHSLMSIQRRY
jgi:hypothetical protein